MKVPILILGGGLAGLTAAIHLSKMGHEITVVEKSEYPKHKVCGEYISNEVVDYFNWLGLQHVLAQSHPIHNFRLEIDESNVSEVKLPLGGFGISRYSLDDLLYQKAKEQGCQFIHEAVVSVKFIDDLFHIILTSGLEIETPIAIGSFGKRSTIDVHLQRDFIQKKAHWLAVKAHYEGLFSDNLVGLYPFQGGYCGVSKVEQNRLNICYIVQTDVFKKYKNISDFTENVLFENKGLKKIMSESKSVFEMPLTISQISFDDKKAVENHVLMIGDAAGLIHPLCGNGMAMAIHSAKIVSELVHKSLNNQTFSRGTLEQDYQKIWNTTFKNRLNTGKMLSKLLLNPSLTKVSLKTVAKIPLLFKYIIKKTHGNPITISIS
ncbi:NAD(P)/FAD-dependent oxidoreductase [Flavobacterium antarcticum]|uniref:NAD(P)/FAD-dependent oxidoreductase n=1 Tax=Flavobacterium antarcticum TaxID=271155 RepID=UPI0003B38B13|nr:FAD-dependent oxidoreductase [Flavobacterium antarcticum]